MSQKRKKKKPTALLIVLIVLLALIIIAAAYYMHLTDPVRLTDEASFTVAQGSSAADIAQGLYDAGLIKSPMLFRLYIKSEGIGNELKAGDYTFSGIITFDSIKNELLTGVSGEDVSVTIPEGLTVKETAQIFAEKGLVDADTFMDFTQNGDFLYDYLPAKGTENRLEGYLFPDTYRIGKGWTEKEIVNTLLAQFDKVWTDEFQKKADELAMTQAEVITLASIIEKEAKVKEDRPLISSVFHNRLDTGMMLQSCATVQFILGEPKNPLLYKDLEIPSPYNTYLNAGLPPGPIASPGKASLEAALFYDDTDYYYFLAKPDGSHYFSKTLEEHNAAKEKYIDN